MDDVADGPFDLGALAEAVERERRRRGLALSYVSKEIGMSVSTIRRFATAADAEADGVLAAVRWLGVAPEDFITESTVRGVRLGDEGRKMIRVIGPRTSIQRLVTAAEASGQAVASLTRWSDA